VGRLSAGEREVNPLMKMFYKVVARCGAEHCQLINHCTTAAQRQYVALTRLIIYATVHFHIIELLFTSFELGWFRGAAVERWSLTGEHSLSCARPTADG